MQFPNLYVANCDLNLTGPERFIRQRDPTLSYSYDDIPLKDDGAQRPVNECLQHLFDCLTKAAQDPTIKTIAIDSLTHVNEYVIQHILRLGGRKDMEIRDWISFKSRFLELLFSYSRNSGKTVIMTVHESIIEEVDPKNVMKKNVIGYQPSISGGITDYFGAFFTDVWRCTIDRVGQTPTNPLGLEARLTTARNSKSDLKNSLGLPPEMKADYKLIEAQLNK